METVRDLIDRIAETRPKSPFLISPDTGTVVTFEGLRNRALCLYGELRELGLELGDKVAFLMDNGLSSAQLFLGAMYGGFVPVPLNVRAGVSQLSYTLDNCDSAVVFVTNKYGALADDVVGRVQRPIRIIPRDVDFCRSLGEASTELPLLSGEAPALLMYSSGTTARPNGAVHTHRSILAHGRNAMSSHQLTAEDRSLLVLPLYHINAECVTLMPTLMSGGSVVVPHGFSVSEFWKLLDQYRCTWAALVPTIISQLLDWKDPNAERGPVAFPHIRFFRTSSAPLSPSLHREFSDKFKFLLIQAMGSSEAGNVFSNPLPPGRNKIGSPGLPWGFEAKIVDRRGAELPSGEPGEIQLRGDGMMREYYKDLAGTTAALDCEGWLHTGDLAYRDEDGYFFIVGRSKELIIKGGMNIAPKQVDEVLEAHPAVLEAAAVGIPDRYVGEDLVAFAVLRMGMSCHERDLLSFCESHLGHFKTPTRIYFVQDLPKGPSGKVQRLRLIEEAGKRSITESVSDQSEPETPLRELNVGRTTLCTADSSLEQLEQIIGGIWSDLLAQPQIDPQSNFFALGGQSLIAIQYLSRVREKIAIMLSLSDFFENPTIASQAKFLKERLSNLTAQGTADVKINAESRPIPRRDRASPCPLSLSQARLWFLQQLLSGAPVYNEAEAVRLKGKLDLEALERSLNLVIARHEVLRSTIAVGNGTVDVVVHDNWSLKIKQVDLSELPAMQRETELERLLVDEPKRQYRLETEPGIRTTVIHLAADENALIIMMHHLFCDSSSLGILWRELAKHYDACLRGQPLGLPPLPVQYGDYAVWQRQPARESVIEEDLSFWRKRLRDAPDRLDLPSDRPRPSINSFRGTKRVFSVGSLLASNLRSFSRQARTSLFTIFATALNVLFYRYTGKDDILLGIPIADRDRLELRSLIGFMIDTVALRTELKGNPSFRELMTRVQLAVAEAYSHRAAQFDQVVDSVKPQRDLSYSPLVQVMLNWRDRDEQPQFMGLSGFRTEPLLAHSETAKFDLTLTITDTEDDILLEAEYNTDLFDDARVVRMVGHLRTLLEGVVTDSEERVGYLPMLTTAERDQLVEWNRTEATHPKDRCLHELFEEQVERTPGAVAVAYANEQLTYRQLDERANQLAHYLQKLGVVPDTLVGISMERSLEMIVGLLGILKAGGAYVPLDPEYPKERLAFMLEDAGVCLVLTQAHLTTSLPAHQARTIQLDADWPLIAQESASHITSSVKAGHLAYMIYTSGSTGRPKGAMNGHVAIVNRILWMQDAYRLAPSDRVLQKTPFSFDVSVWEFFWPLLIGAKLVLALPGSHKDAEYLSGLIYKEKITTIHFVPSMLSIFLEQTGLESSCASLERVICSGEALPFDLQQRFFSTLPAELHNLYGPTEAAVDVTHWRCERKSRLHTVPIGRPIANTQIHILDKHLQHVPIGVAGELHIGGIAVGQGYHNRPELTAEKFITDPFRTEAGARLYKTGDLARYLPTGAIEYLGRLDLQVKIRGFRIELEEVESALTHLPGVREAVVVASGDVSGTPQLVAYITRRGRETLDEAKLRRDLRAKVPEYMVPSALVVLDRLPLTPNGKVDRRALPAPDKKRIGSDYEAPITESERRLAEIWGKWLNVEYVGRRHNFFDLGGNSLLVAWVVGEINKQLKTNLLIPELFQNPTIDKLARVLKFKNSSGPKPRLVSLRSEHGRMPLYFIGAGPVEYRLGQLLAEGLTAYCVDVPVPVEWRRAIQHSDSDALPTIEELGELYGSVLQSHAGSSPCVIVGYSFFGKMAFEAARVVRQNGGNVVLVILIDAFTWSGLTSGTARRSWRWIWRRARADDARLIARSIAAFGNSFRLLCWILAQTPRVIRHRVIDAVRPSSIADKEGVPIEQSLVIRLSSIIGKLYHPRPLDASGVLIRGEFPLPRMLPGYDSTNGWRGLFSEGLEIIQASGDHGSMVSDERNTAALARQIDKLLERFMAKTETRSEPAIAAMAD